MGGGLGLSEDLVLQWCEKGCVTNGVSILVVLTPADVVN